MNWLWFRAELPTDFGAVEVRSKVRGRRLALWMLVFSLGYFSPGLNGQRSMK